MTQKINFLIFLQKPENVFLTSRKIFLSVICFCIILLILILAQRHHLATLEKSVASLQQQLNTLQQQIAEINKQKTLSLEQRLVSYKNINKLGLNNLTDFFKKISEINLCGLWLTQLNMGDGGDHVVLQGQLYQKELIFQYQQRLQKWTLLSNDVLTLNLVGPSKKEQPFQFSMIWDKHKNA